jgi:hypothetical protein
VPKPAAKPAAPSGGTAPTVMAPPTTGEGGGFLRAPSSGEAGFGFITPPNTGDAGLSGPARASGDVMDWILLVGVAGAIALAGVKFSRAGR